MLIIPAVGKLVLKRLSGILSDWNYSILYLLFRCSFYFYSLNRAKYLSIPQKIHEEQEAHQTWIYVSRKACLWPRKKHNKKHLLTFSSLWQQFKQQLNYSFFFLPRENRLFFFFCYYKTMIFHIFHVKKLVFLFSSTNEKTKGIGRKIAVSLLQHRNCHN